MDKLLIVLLGAAGVAALLFIAVLLGTFFGGVAGYIVGLVFPYVTDTVRELAGYTEAQLSDFQVGAILGFVGSFLKSSSSSSSS